MIWLFWFIYWNSNTILHHLSC